MEGKLLPFFALSWSSYRYIRLWTDQNAVEDKVQWFLFSKSISLFRRRLLTCYLFIIKKKSWFLLLQCYSRSSISSQKSKAIWSDLSKLLLSLISNDLRFTVYSLLAECLGGRQNSSTSETRRTRADVLTWYYTSLKKLKSTLLKVWQ